MYTIRNYTNTNCELEMAKTRLNLLMDRKEELYCKYFPITSRPKEIIVDGGSHENNKMADYVHELHMVDLGTGMSLAEEIEYEQALVNKLEAYLNKMNDSLSKMTGIENELFYEIVFKGTNITKAVEVIAERNEKEPQTIWKNYYGKIKREIKEISKYSKKIQ